MNAPAMAQHRSRWPLIGVLALTTALLALFWPAMAGAQVARNLQPNGGKDCAVCHVEWMESFNEPRAVVLMPEPEKPLVAESETCLGCHDGAVDDSRREVWIEHSHKTGIAPSAGMKIPAELPLENGKLACRTCHTAHSVAGANTLKDAVFLRLRNDEGQLCKACHADKSQGPESGSHPVGRLPWELPQPLLEAGSHAGDENRSMVCQTCHAAHGSSQDQLLVMATDSSQLCITCHAQMRPAMWDKDATHEHPQNPPLRNDSQRRAIQTMGTRVGADDRLICLSCHKMHGAKAGRAMLADTLADSRLCISCHEDRQNIVGSQHDLRKSAPNEINARGQTLAQSGPCGACHTFHSYAREARPANGDPQGLCTTCHSEGQIAARHTGQPFSHPSEVDQRRVPADARLALYPSKDDPNKKAVACLSCHNPHETKHPHFLRTEGDELCASCHGTKMQTLAGAHDFAGKDLRNAKGRTAQQTGKCGFCHAVHNANGPAMWVATADKPKNTEEMCASCHKADGIAGKHPVATFNHPTGPQARLTSRPENLGLPLFNEQSHQVAGGFVTCSSCHDVHQSPAQARSLLRSEDAASLCVQCHPNHAAVAGGQHDPRKGEAAWPDAARTGDLCTSCHRPHSNDPDRRRWAVAPVGGTSGEAACLGCHKDTGWNTNQGDPVLGSIMHPQTVPTDSRISKVSHGLPLGHANDGKGQLMSCGTCHNPHSSGKPHLLRVKEGGLASDLCLSCHEDARYVTRSMHSPELLDPDKPGNHACRPCHATHAIPGSQKRLMWSAHQHPAGGTESERLCLGCHGPAGNAKRPTIVQHPNTAMKKLAALQPPEIRSRLEKIDEITCHTCHLPHGREVPVDPAASPAEIARAQLSAVKPMLRADVDREVCSICHGIDSTRVYLYYHNPKKRAAVQKLLGR